MRDILRAIAPILNDLPNKISLAGHTDDFQYATGDRGYSNWELSADRANASRRELVAGARWQQNAARGGHVRHHEAEKSRRRWAVNRRISLLVLNHDTQAQIEKRMPKATRRS